MRVLIISTAFLACAVAAPSGLVFGVPFAPAVNIIPTLSPGDIQAASIDAKVAADNAKILAEDEARAALDRQNEKISEGTENLSAKAITPEDLIKENNAEAVWASEDKKWQALDALKTAEAQIDGSIASVSPALAKNAVAGLYTPYISAIAPGIAPAPFIYSSAGFVAPGVKTISTQSLVQSLDDSVQVEAAAKAAPEAVKPVEAERSEAVEKVEKVESAPLVKAAEAPEQMAEKVESAPVLKAAAVPVEAPLAGLVDARFPFLAVVPYSSYAFTQPAVAYSSAVQHGPFLAPSIVKSGW